MTQTTAAATGATATERFQIDKTHGSDTPPERVSLLARQVLEAVYATIREHQVTYAEYDALKAWLIQVGADGEWPLFLDVFVEHVVEEVANAEREGSKGTIEGPFYAPGAPEFGAVWHCDDAGLYAQFAPGIPQWNLRGRVTADENGHFTIRTIQPAPYQIPTDGATGAMIRAATWHAWRPAHVHLKVPMLFAVTMDVRLPDDLADDARADVLTREKAYSLALQRAGEWVSIWPIAGRYANLSISMWRPTTGCTRSCGTSRCSGT